MNGAASLGAASLVAVRKVMASTVYRVPRVWPEYVRKDLYAQSRRSGEAGRHGISESNRSTCIQGSAGVFDLLQDIGGTGGPDEGFGALVVTVDISADSHDQLFQIAKDAEPRAVLREIAEETLHHVEPRCAGGMKCI
jgi:hypothetical protein